jgi:hypothetical protein
MIAYKLVHRRKDGSLGPLFIKRIQIFNMHEWIEAESHPTKGYALRPGFHCCAQPVAPHLSFGPDRAWVEVEITDVEGHMRSLHQGGLWFTAKRMKILRML